MPSAASQTPPLQFLHLILPGVKGILKLQAWRHQMHWLLGSTPPSSVPCQLLSALKGSELCPAAVITISSISHAGRNDLRLQPWWCRRSLCCRRSRRQPRRQLNARRDTTGFAATNVQEGSTLNMHIEIQAATPLQNRTNSCLSSNITGCHPSDPISATPCRNSCSNPSYSASPLHRKGTATHAGTCETATAATAASKAQAMWRAADRE